MCRTVRMKDNSEFNVNFSDMNSDDDISNSSGRHVHYFESSITSNESESSEMDKYLDEAMDSDEDDVVEARNRSGKESVSVNAWMQIRI